MRLREVSLQAAKPLCTVALVGVVVSVLRIAIPLFVVDPPVIDSRDVAECLLLSDEVNKGSPGPIRSVSQVWQPSGVDAMAFSSNGKYLATGGHGGTIGIWKTGDWTRVCELDQEGWIASLAFSPDGQWLFVAGDAGSRRPLLCRFRWQTGERERVYAGHTSPVDGMAISADGQTLVTSSRLGDELRIWDATSGVSIRTFACRNPAFVYAPRRNFIFSWDSLGPGYATAYLDGARVPHVLFPGKPMAAAFGGDEQLLFAARHLDSAARGAEVSLAAYRPEGGPRSKTPLDYRAITEVRFPGVWDDEAVLAVAPDGRQVAVASGDVRLAMYAMPGLKLIREFHFPCRSTRSQRICRLVYSPNGRWLAAAQKGRTTPRLFDAATTEEIIPNQRNGNFVHDLRFSADGRTLRTIDDDGTVCVQDATTMTVLRRLSIPTGYVVGAIRPSDGRYAVCSDVVDPTRPIQVVDLDTGKCVSQAKLPLTWKGLDLPSGLEHAGPVLWLGDREVLCTGWVTNRWWRFNLQTGEILAEGDLRSIPPQRVDSALEPSQLLLYRQGEVTEDGEHLFVVGGGGMGSPPDVAGLIQLRTFRATELGRIDRPVNGGFGLVPGGKYFHIGLRIYDRRSLRLVAAKDFPTDVVEIQSVTFSPEGSRYAVMLRHLDHDEQPPAVILVHETLTSRILSAFTPPAGVARFRFSQDGTQLGIAYHDGTLEVRTVNASQAARPVEQ